ncbi:hypothetical protein [Microcoleus sp. F10B5]|uniref:hypothetical protein n=1 Tax=Microcoleus sp. F10B5 TaxID=3055341 RepID=UPI002FD64263
MSFNERRGKKEEGRRKREEGRKPFGFAQGKKREEGRFFPLSDSPHLPLSNSLAPSPPLPCDNTQNIAY